MRRLAQGLVISGCVAFTSIAPIFAARQAADVSCRATPPARSTSPNIFTESQENDLGDVIAERLATTLDVIDDPALIEPLARIGQRVIDHLPPTELKFRFFLIDTPDANAFVLPGGRIFVTRKLIASAAREDELAGVIGHELGHLLARQQTAAITRQLKEVLGVTSVGDRKNIFDTYNRLIDNIAKKPGALNEGSREDKDQVDADRIGLFAVAAAGYDPSAVADFMDRMLETNGKTGNFWSDLVGTTSPESKRLRELLKTSTTLPTGCGGRASSATAASYQDWRSSVVAYSGIGRAEQLHDVVSKTRLQVPLRGDLTALRFSPNGQWIAALDNAGATVLTHRPFAAAFRIPSRDAIAVHFTPDSSHVVLRTATNRVELWNVSTRARVWAREVITHPVCLQSALSPDAQTLACIDTDFSFQLYDVATGAKRFTKKEFVSRSPGSMLLLLLTLAARGLEAADDLVGVIGFSPDGRFVVAGRHLEGIPQFNLVDVDSALVYDLQANAPVELKGAARRLIAGGFYFTSATELIGRNANDLTKSARVQLPSGDVGAAVTLINGSLDAATHSPLVMVRPLKNFAVGFYDLTQGKVVSASAVDAADIFDDEMVAERTGGELALYKAGTSTLIQATALPADEMSRPTGVALSADGQFLAVSANSRSGMWNTVTGQRVLGAPGFKGGAFDAAGLFYGDFPKLADGQRALAKFDPGANTGAMVSKLGEMLATQSGLGLVVRRPLDKGVPVDQAMMLEYRDVHTGAMLWSRKFDREPPRVVTDNTTGTVALFWPTTSDIARSIVKQNAHLSKQLADMKEREGDYLVELCDPLTGAARGRVLVETGNGSFRIDSAVAAGDWLALTDSASRVLLFSVSSGEIMGRAFGGRPHIAAASGLMAVQNGPSRVTVYDITSMRAIDTFQFANAVVHAALPGDGRQLMVLTADQQVTRLSIKR